MVASNFISSLIHVTGWGTAPSRPRPLSAHFRTRSSVAAPTLSSTTTATTDSPPPSPLSVHKPRIPTKAPSTSALPTIRTSPSQNFFGDEMSTIPDPRSRPRSPSRQGSTASSNHHPDLTDEVATLSTKLINAINHTTVLDDTLSATRHELDTANERIRSLEEQNASQREMLAGDVWVRRSTVDAERKSMLLRIAEEKTRTGEMEKAKKKIEQELENLTAALFEEANKMVIRAKEEAQVEQDAIQRKNDQLKAQLADSESLLKSQQEQLSELKNVMEVMASERDDVTNPTAPSSPRASKADIRDDPRFISHSPSSSGPVEPVAPAHPCSFTHLLQPVLRIDLGNYDEFINLVRLSRGNSGNRVSSGSIGGLNLTSLGLGGSTSSNNGGAAAVSSAPQSPNTPASAGSPPPAAIAPTNLKDTRFFKRVLAEDIEPTLRLDAAPGLSWLARRSVVSAMTDGSLVVDPVSIHPGNQYVMNLIKPQFHPCSLCGETRREADYLRNHRFRTSEQESAQRYPLCKYCLGRVRSTCDFLSFLRMVKDGHWRADDEEQEKAAWEEGVRLREQMFWARVGGGVVPYGQLPATPATPAPDADRAAVKPAHDVKKESKDEDQFYDSNSGVEQDDHEATDVSKQPQTPPAQIASPANDAEEPRRLSITIP